MFESEKSIELNARNRIYNLNEMVEFCINATAIAYRLHVKRTHIRNKFARICTFTTLYMSTTYETTTYRTFYVCVCL